MINEMYKWNELKEELNKGTGKVNIGAGTFNNLMGQANITPSSFYPDERNVHRGLFTEMDLNKLKKLVEKRGLRKYN